MPNSMLCSYTFIDKSQEITLFLKKVVIRCGWKGETDVTLHRQKENVRKNINLDSLKQKLVNIS